ncbi:hypothetical protein LEP1GSC058_2848 [Leptospira fainei serovar Hurstbridge str. BUT 6]|uniref:Yip1 domain protein n=1 Tax=Leptospira fainei serovar Hurstbridge str. BUT 6 TaxID=1193011 RepID=S3UYQ6_9LEPT|nr:hypothetical protein [Leptospira fainei]EPG74368.1 hypothetical protein LEP1GSC058_2848 [Leptospira fainei serovar Hurstbridge str. BUT 6]
MNLSTETIKKHLLDNLFTRGFFRNLEYNLHPESVLKADSRAFLKDTFRTFGLFLLTYIAFNLFVSLFNLEYLNVYGNRMKEFYQEGRIALSMYVMNAFPYNILFMAFFILLFQLYVATISYVALWVLGEAERSYERMLGIAFSTGLYVLLSFFPILILFSIAPESIQKDTFKMVLFLSLNGIFFLTAVILQCVFYLRMTRIVFHQNYGRAILTWLGPFLFFVLVVVTNL